MQPKYRLLAFRNPFKNIIENDDCLIFTMLFKKYEYGKE
jgi:hypothetical protein